jgi:hypothetical protein
MVLGAFKAKPSLRDGGFASLERASAPWRVGPAIERKRSQGDRHVENLFSRFGDVS